MALPGNGTILAVDPKRQDLYKAGRQADRGAGQEGPQAARHHQPQVDRQRPDPRHGHGRLDQHRAAHAGHGQRGGRPVRPRPASTRSSAQCPNICKVSPSTSKVPRRGRGRGGRDQCDPRRDQQGAGPAEPRLPHRDRQDARREHRRRRDQEPRGHSPAGRTPTPRPAGWPSCAATSPRRRRGQEPPASPRRCSRTPVRPSSSTARKRPATASWPARSRRATWSSSATKAPRAARACRRCSARPATSWARGWAKRSP